MGFFDELLAGGASFELAKKYEEHNNPNDKHAFLKEIAAGLTGAEAEKLIAKHGPEAYQKLREEFNEKSRHHDDIEPIQNQGGY